MKIFKCIVSSIPYSYISLNGKTTTNFLVQVDRKIYIRGELKIVYCSDSPLVLEIGSKIKITGFFEFKNGIICRAKDIKIY